MANLSQIVDDLSALTVLEAAELAKMLEEKWGVPPLPRRSPSLPVLPVPLLPRSKSRPSSP